MTKLILRALKDPHYAAHIVMQRYFPSRRSRVFAHAKEYRSESESGDYAAAILSALKNQKAFDNFKRKPAYRTVLEHVSLEQGRAYLDIVRDRRDGLLEKALRSVLKRDDVGNPIKYKYDEYDFPLSPTTLRYLKVTSDLKGLFGQNLGEVAEIGCGYGGQAYVNDQLLNVQMATLFDLPYVNILIERYLNTLLLDGAYKTASINQVVPRDYDLVISNYAFSELPSVLQDVYIKKVLSRSARGYLTMNTGLTGGASKGKMSFKELREKLPQFEVFEENPVTSPNNYMIIWGHNAAFASSNFREKKVNL